MTPKIIFKYSWIYDQNWKKWIKIYYKNAEYPSPHKVQKYIKDAEKLWRRHEKEVLAELSKVTGLKWREKTVICYVVGNCIPFSEPLTLRVCNPLDYFIDVLTHEMVHQLFIQGDNEKRAYKAWDYFHKRYSTENFNARIHIPVHAIHWHIFSKFFTEKRLQREIKSLSHLADYKKAWDIVQGDGHQNIIKEFKKRVK